MEELRLEDDQEPENGGLVRPVSPPAQQGELDDSPSSSDPPWWKKASNPKIQGLIRSNSITPSKQRDSVIFDSTEQFDDKGVSPELEPSHSVILNDKDPTATDESGSSSSFSQPQNDPQQPPRDYMLIISRLEQENQSLKARLEETFSQKNNSTDAAEYDKLRRTIATKSTKYKDMIEIFRNEIVHLRRIIETKDQEVAELTQYSLATRDEVLELQQLLELLLAERDKNSPSPSLGLSASVSLNGSTSNVLQQSISPVRGISPPVEESSPSVEADPSSSNSSEETEPSSSSTQLDPTSEFEIERRFRQSVYRVSQLYAEHQQRVSVIKQVEQELEATEPLVCLQQTQPKLERVHSYVREKLAQLKNQHIGNEIPHPFDP